jgi:alpha-beta hydrolase superfamily lysophospholipase
MPDDEAEAYMRRLTRESFRAVAVDALLLQLPRPRPRQTPLLVLGGTHDTLFTVTECKRTAHAYGTNARLYPGMGHDLMLDSGWEQVAADILAWLDERTNPIPKAQTAPAPKP